MKALAGLLVSLHLIGALVGFSLAAADWLTGEYGRGVMFFGLGALFVFSAFVADSQRYDAEQKERDK